MQRYSKTKRRVPKRHNKPSLQVVQASIVGIFDEVSGFVIDGLKAFPMEDDGQSESDTKQPSRKIS